MENPTRMAVAVDLSEVQVVWTARTERLQAHNLQIPAGEDAAALAHSAVGRLPH